MFTAKDSRADGAGFLEVAGARDTAPKFLDLELLSQPLLRHILCYTEGFTNPKVTMTRSIFAIGSALLLACISLTQSAQAAITPISFVVATKNLRGYCLERLCLGMKVEEVTALGRIELDDNPFNGPFSCSPDKTMPAPSTAGELVTGDGVRFRLGFEQVTRSGFPGSRFRLTFVALRLPGAEPFQVDQMTKDILSRYKVTEDKGRNTWGTIAPDGQSEVFVRKSYAGQAAPQEPPNIMMLAVYAYRYQWIDSLPECRGGLPKP